ncbi:MAG: ABC transporter ATP-binding protein [Anaerolineae bacterium]|nr:ABC transporter ATP-binding protein [Anaerolineae bacterium]
MTDAVTIHRVSKSFGRIQAVRDLSLTIPAGITYGLLGPNGAGKTTLIRLLAGLLRADAGEIDVLGARMPDKAVLAHIGYMTQAHALYTDLTVRENVSFFGALAGRVDRARVDEVLALVELTDRADSLVGTLSGGLKQRTSLACALVHNPRLLLLDEPTVGVDPQLRVQFWTYFRQLNAEGVTIIVSSHVMDEAERCDRLGFMRQGQLLAEGDSASLRERAGTDTLEAAFLRFADQGMPEG